MFENELINNRRKFRKLAEIGWLEMQTTIEIIKTLKEYGFDVTYGKKIHRNRMGVPDELELKKHAENIDKNVDFNIDDILEGYTGCIATISGKNPGKTIGLRFDIDALPIHETDDLEHIPNKLQFRAFDNKANHACGHDGHIAIGLGIAHYIAKNIDKLNGNYKLIFQPAEEGVRGAKSLIESGIIDDIDFILALHIGMGKKGILGVGTIGFLATSKFDVKFKGISAHAGKNPELGKNSLLAAASCTLNLHTLPQFGAGKARINVGVLKSEGARNIIPQESLIQFETRGETEEILYDLNERAKKIIEGSAKAFDVSYEIDEVGRAIDFITIHPEFVDYMGKELAEKGYMINLRPNLGGSEDVSFMLKRVENNGGYAIHYLLGTNLKASHHSDKFDYDESVLNLGFNALKDSIDIINKNFKH